MFLDEVQNVDNFEKVVNSLRASIKNISIFLTGSNSKMLSDELSSVFSGRYVLFNINPLSYKEYVSLTKKDGYDLNTFWDYAKWGGLPNRCEFTNVIDIKNYLHSVYDSIILRDVIKRLNLKDTVLFDMILQYLIETAGREFSADNIIKYLNNENKKISNETLYNYIDALCKALILKKVYRYDIAGKGILKTLNKYLGKRKITAAEQRAMNSIMNSLSVIYGNKSSDEYKSHGNITRVSCYKNIETMLADLSSLKKFSVVEAKDLKSLFATLHRPMFGKLVTEFINEPTERNTIYACLYATGYRALVSELSRIYASTEATEKGLVYKPDKISRKNGMADFIKAFNDNLDKKLDAYIRDTNKNVGYIPVKESVGELFDAATVVVSGILDVFPRIFRSAKELNPISLINALLMRSYDKKIEKFEEVSNMYEATKAAYDEYLKIPSADRKRKIESKYQKNLKKYNIKMENLSAQIKHYDQRADEEAKDSLTSNSKPSTNTTKQTTTSSDDDFDF